MIEIAHQRPIDRDQEVERLQASLVRGKSCDHVTNDVASLLPCAKYEAEGKVWSSTVDDGRVRRRPLQIRHVVDVERIDNTVVCAQHRQCHLELWVASNSVSLCMCACVCGRVDAGYA